MSKKSQYTPGPWIVDNSGFGVRDCYPNGKHNMPYRMLAHCGPGWSTENQPEAEANARLIAAAPELLEALKRIMDPTRIPQKLSDFEFAYAAIAKAEGNKVDE